MRKPFMELMKRLREARKAPGSKDEKRKIASATDAEIHKLLGAEYKRYRAVQSAVSALHAKDGGKNTASTATLSPPPPRASKYLTYDANRGLHIESSATALPGSKGKKVVEVGHLIRAVKKPTITAASPPPVTALPGSKGKKKKKTMEETSTSVPPPAAVLLPGKKKKTKSSTSSVKDEQR